MQHQAIFAILLLPTVAAGCLAGSAAEAEDRLLANEVPTKVSRSTTGDFFVDPKTDLGWSTRVSVELDYSEAPFYCASLGSGWRLPTIGELKTMTKRSGDTKVMRQDFKAGLPNDGLLFSSEEIPVIDDDKQPLVMSIADGKTLNGHGREGYARCTHGPVTRQRAAFPQPGAELLGERWWDQSKACPTGSVARGTIGLEVACRDKEGKRSGKSTRWSKGERVEANYRDDKLSGTLVQWRSASGTVAELNYRNGEFHGRSTYWYPSGQKSSASEFSGGVLNGLQETWDAKGQLVMQTRYRKGRIVDQLYFDAGKARDGAVEQKYANGVASYIGLFKKGRAIGQHYGYHEDGKLRFKRKYNTKGIPDGDSADWHVNGHPHEVSTFKNGALEGERAVFAADGATLSREHYAQGLVVNK